MAKLYTNSQGKDVSIHSYSAGGEFRYCKRRYYLSRIKGYKEIRNTAAQEWGKCMESAIQYFYENNKAPKSVADEFERLWELRAEIKGLEYTEKEIDHSNLMRAGKEMAMLYEILEPTFPIVNPRFQLNYKKEVFPGSYLAGIEDTSYIDLYSAPESGPIIIDIKTTASAPPALPMLLLDRQLREYAWITGVSNEAFLWMQKNFSRSISKGDRITVLEDWDDFKAGMVRLAFPYAEDSFTVLTEDEYAEWKKKSKGLKGKKLDALAVIFGSDRPDIPIRHVTKQRIFFLQVHIPDADIKETGRIVGQDIVEIHTADESNFWPQTGAGIRWPNDKCLKCPMRGNCTGDANLRDSLVTIKGDWLDNVEYCDD